MYMQEILDTMENEDLKALAEDMIKTIPEYFWHVPASSTGKYHPSYSLGEGGLMRHTIGLCRIMNHLFTIEDFDSRQRDLLRIAGMMHDTRKSGSQSDYEKNKYTKFEHPLLAGDVIRDYIGTGYNDNEIDYIARCVESHMGQFNKDKHSSYALPLPESKGQKFVHMCDYLASRKDIILTFDNENKDKNVSIDSIVMPFGKHKGEKLINIDKNYLKWTIENVDLRGDLKEYIEDILNGRNLENN